MKKWIFIGSLVVIAGLFGLGLVSTQNKLVLLDEEVRVKWSQVENQYKRRADMIPQIVEVVRGVAGQEKSLFIGVTEAHAKATQVKVSITNEAEFRKYQEAQAELTRQFGMFVQAAANLPQMKSNENFTSLQKQIEGTENRIAVERLRYFETAKPYNIAIRQFPANIFAGFLGYKVAAAFQITEQEKAAPAIKF